MKAYNLFIFLCTSVALNAQTAADVFRDETRITLAGIDFSKAKFIGDEALQDEKNIQKFMLAINYLLRDEADKYYFSKALRKARIEDALQITMEKNKEIIAKDHVVNDEHFTRPLNRGELDDIVAAYDYQGNDGIALMLIVDKLDKFHKKAFIWYTFIDMKNKKILFTEYKNADPAGFGPRNYWARAVHMNIIEIKVREYKLWKAKYGSPNP
jgi:hypothetical protein